MIRASPVIFHCNLISGYIGLVVALLALPLLMYLQYNVLSVYNLFRPMLVSCQLMAAVLSVVLFIKSFYVSKKELHPAGSRGYYLADFLEGRQCAPTLFGFDMKLVIFRTTILMNVSFLMHGIMSECFLRIVINSYELL